MLQHLITTDLPTEKVEQSRAAASSRL